ncbi:MAG: hypothetical protein ACFFCW_04555 [Candidatus Hodarchaeota archaeon]
MGFGKLLNFDIQKVARVLAGVYVGGVFYLGLRLQPLKANHDEVLLSVKSFQWHDFIINTAGFILVGYLLMPCFGIRGKDQRDDSLLVRAIAVTLIGRSIGLFSEASQYYLMSGRYSNLMDLIANTLGTLLGTRLYLMEYLIIRRET